MMPLLPIDREFMTQTFKAVNEYDIKTIQDVQRQITKWEAMREVEKLRKKREQPFPINSEISDIWEWQNKIIQQQQRQLDKIIGSFSGSEKNQELDNEIMAIRAMFGDIPLDEVMMLLQKFIQEHQRKQTNKPETVSMLPETPADIKQLARENGRKGKEKQLQNNVKEKFRLGKFQELFPIWAARLQSQEYGVQAKFIAIVQAHYDEYIDDLIAKDVKMSEKDKVLNPDAVRRWLKRMEH